MHFSNRAVRAAVVASLIGAAGAVVACNDSYGPQFPGPGAASVTTLTLAPRDTSIVAALDSAYDSTYTIPADTTVVPPVVEHDTTVTVHQILHANTAAIISTLTDASGNVVDPTAVPPQTTTGWTTSDPTVATVDVAGNVTSGTTPGTVFIYGNLGKLADSVTVNVTPYIAAKAPKGVVRSRVAVRRTTR